MNDIGDPLQTPTEFKTQETKTAVPMSIIRIIRTRKRIRIKTGTVKKFGTLCKINLCAGLGCQNSSAVDIIRIETAAEGNTDRLQAIDRVNVMLLC